MPEHHGEGDLLGGSGGAFLGRQGVRGAGSRGMNQCAKCHRLAMRCPRTLFRMHDLGGGLDRHVML